jgi:hypothetical protein
MPKFAVHTSLTVYEVFFVEAVDRDHAESRVLEAEWDARQFIGNGDLKVKEIIEQIEDFDEDVNV